MKKIILSALALVALASCSKDLTNDPTESNDLVAATFSSSIGTRASGTSWSEGDEIGVFMLRTDEVSDSENVPYETAAGDGKFAASSSYIYYPQTGTVDFLAYYPYQSGMSDYAYSIDVSDQDDLEAIDLMVATKLTGVSATNDSQSLAFAHMLCEVNLNISKNETIESLEGLTATFGEVLTTNTYDVSGLAFDTAGDADTIDLNVSEDGTTITAILVPQTISAQAITFTVEEKSYVGYLTETLESGKSYTYSVTIGQEIFTVGAATITDWVAGTQTSTTITTQMQEE